MSQENVELTLLVNDAWNRRDAVAVVALWDPQGVWFPPFEGIMEGRTYRGHAGVRQYFEDLAEFAEENHADYAEVHDLGDQVLGLGTAHFRFTSGVELDQEVAVLQTWRNGSASKRAPGSITPKPSKPPGCGSRRCRRRTSRSRGATWGAWKRESEGSKPSKP
jgi:ketosteroid isomerase-like protein